jgi:3-oxoacyl-[acyl-carrier-protein] synthase-3
MREPVVARGGLKLLGAGKALPTCMAPDGPKFPVTNDDVLGILAAGATDRQIEAARRVIATTGVQTRYWSRWVGGPVLADEPTASDLGYEAAVAALADAGATIAEVRLVIVALSTSTLPTIASCTPLVAKLGYEGPSFDLKGGCAGTLYALHLASQLMPVYGRILVIGTDTMSRYVDRHALQGFLNVGDGAGALLLGPSDTPNFVSAIDGAYSTWDAAGVFTTIPPAADAVDANPWNFGGKPTQLRDAIAEAYRSSLQHLLTHERVPPSELAAWIPHQIALPLVHGISEAFGLNPFVNGDKYGNTGAASLPIALGEARAQYGKSRVALSALGAGMRWGSALWEDWA